MTKFFLGCSVVFGIGLIAIFWLLMYSLIFPNGCTSAGREVCCFRGGSCFVVKKLGYSALIYPGKGRFGRNRADYLMLDGYGGLDAYGNLQKSKLGGDSITMIVFGRYTMTGDFSKYGIRLLDGRMNGIQEYYFKIRLKELLSENPKETVEIYSTFTSEEYKIYETSHKFPTWDEIYVPYDYH